MSRLLNFIVIIIFCGILAGCSDDQSVSPSNLEGTTFTGVIPCADCQGIAYKITLKKDHRFRTSSVYIGKSNQPYIERGTWNTKGDSLLVLNESEEQARQFKIKNEQLVMLDKQGKEVSGSLAQMYVLSEADTTADHQWQKRRKQGIDFHAAGNEPSWSLDIDFDTVMIFKTRQGDSINTPVPQMKMDTSHNARTLTVKTESGPLEAALYPTGCVDDMSGEVFNYSVNVKRGETTYQGCGNFVNLQYKLNDFWTLRSLDDTKIDSIDTGPKKPTLHFDLAKNRVYGNTGCNQLSGEIALEDSSISFSKMITTKMACSESMEMESTFLKALQKVDRYDIVNAGLLLMNRQDTLMVFRRAD